MEVVTLIEQIFNISLKDDVFGRALELKPSLIPNSGNGIFTTRNYCKGDTIEEFFGEIFKKGEKVPKKYDLYSYEKKNGDIIGPVDSCMAKYINDAIDLPRCTDYCFQMIKNYRGKITENIINECVINTLSPVPVDLWYDLDERIFCGYNTDWNETSDGEVYIVAIRHIKKGDELYLSYGWYYWRRKLAALLKEKYKAELDVLTEGRLRW